MHLHIEHFLPLETPSNNLTEYGIRNGFPLLKAPVQQSPEAKLEIIPWTEVQT